MSSRKHIVLLGTIALLSLVALIVFGCSSNDDARPTITVTPEDDGGLAIVQAEIDVVVDSTLEFLLAGFNTMAQIPVVENPPDTGEPGDVIIVPVQYGPSLGDSVVAAYTYIGGWHVLAMAADFQTYAASFTDSVQFRNVNGYIEATPEHADAISFRHYWDVAATDTVITHGNLSGAVSFECQHLLSNLAVFNGTVAWNADKKFVLEDYTSWVDVSINSTYTNLSIARTASGWSQSCPISGSVSATLELTRTKTNEDPITTNWRVTLNFDDGMMYANYELVGGDVTSWSEQVCVSSN
jgi:hypothetical protein